MIVNEKFGTLIPFTMIFMIFLAYIGIVVKSLSFGVLIIICVILSLIYTIFKSNNSKKMELLKRNVLTPGFFVYSLLFVCVCLITLNHGADLRFWDEYAHWGQMVKELLRLDDFYIVKGTTLTFHNEYPPAIPILEALWCKLANKYDERIVYAALQVFQLSFFCYPIDGIKCSFLDKPINEKILKLLAFAFFMTSVIFIFSLLDFVWDRPMSCFYASIYTDSILAIVAGFAFYFLVNYNKNNLFYIQLFMLFFVLLMIKQIGICFYVLLLIEIVALWYWERKKEISSRKLMLDKVIFVIILSLLSYGSWKIIYANSYVAHNLAGGFYWKPQFTIPITDIIEKSTKIFSEYHDLIIAYVRALYRTTLVPNIHLSYFKIIFIITLVVFIINRQTKHIIASSCIIIGSIGYALMMLFCYIFLFGTTDQTKLVCFNRYIGTYAYAMVVFTYCFFIEQLNGKYSGIVYSLFLMIIICSLPLINKGMDQFTVVPKFIGNKSCRDIANILIKKTKKGDSVFVVNQGHNDQENLWLAYYTDSRIINREEVSFPLNNKSAQHLQYFKKKIYSYDYLYIKNIDEQFVSNYYTLFSDKNDMKNRSLYSITKNGDGTISLKRMPL